MFCFASVTDLPSGYAYQSITVPFGSFPPYHVPASAAENPEAHRSCSPAAPDPLASSHHDFRVLDAEIKPQRLEPPKAGSFLKWGPCEEHPQPDLSRTTDRATEDDKVDRQAPKTPSPLIPPGENQREVGMEEKNDGEIKTETLSNACEAVKAPPSAPAEDEPKPELIQEAELAPYHQSISAESDSQEAPQMCVSSDQTAVCEQVPPDDTSDSYPPCLEESTHEPPVLGSPLPLLIRSEDPMGGMLALLTASELAQARPRTPPTLTREGQVEEPTFASACSSAAALEMVALEGMALLSQMAQNETELVFHTQG